MSEENLTPEEVKQNIKEVETLKHELHFTNVVIVNNKTLTCIDENNKVRQFKLAKHKAKPGDIVYIIKGSQYRPFTSEYQHKFYEVTEMADKMLLEWVQPCVVVDKWCLYDDQYIVLEEI